MTNSKPVTEKRAREIAHDVLGMHVQYPAPEGHKGLGQMIRHGLQHQPPKQHPRKGR